MLSAGWQSLAPLPHSPWLAALEDGNSGLSANVFGKMVALMMVVMMVMVMVMITSMM